MVDKFCVKYETSGSRDMEEYFLLLRFLNLRVLFFSFHGHKVYWKTIEEHLIEHFEDLRRRQY